MKKAAKYFYYSFPIQLLVLHLRKSQSLLLFWAIPFLTVTGHFMKLFGADGLFLAPEYLGTVNPLGSAIVGIAAGIFIMSWNIATFILHSSRFRFLAATTNPFLKYCLNNAIIPAIFLIVYFFEAYHYAIKYELIPFDRFLLISLSFLGGLTFLHIISFAYFFTADRRIVRRIQPGIFKFSGDQARQTTQDAEASVFELPVLYYASGFFKFHKARDVSHYSLTFLDSIFKRHHFSAIITILLAFILLISIGFFLDRRAFQLPAGASIFIFFALMVAVIAALGYFLRSWSFLFVVLFYFLLNALYVNNIIDPRNRAYGLDYRSGDRPAYTLETLQSLNTPEKIAADKENMIGILNRWKARQQTDKPLLVMLNFSGGGLRGASFSMNALQHLDSATNGQFLRRAFMMSGASGGMLAATYFRELYRQKQEGFQINLQDKKYLKNVSEDLLNPVFSSLVARDFIAPTQRFTYNGFSYIKDRGYAFEEKFNRNTGGVLDHPVGFYSKAESSAEIPLVIFNSVVTRDLKKMILSTQPVSFLMQEAYIDSASKFSGPDAIDFGALFRGRSPMDVRVLTALRMNATYPYVLPAVWLPTHPIIDVMDAGLRDNNGEETTLRFLYAFKDWINENTSGVVIVQFRSTMKGSWDTPYKGSTMADAVTRPVSMLQSNWFKVQEYNQNDEITYSQGFLKDPIRRLAFMYVPEKQQTGAPLNFHLTAREKEEVASSLYRENNEEVMKDLIQILKSDR
ncbi:MAG: patatin-like phospholipase family protein [Chitinophagaceae bacterium]|nr:patatin-like phospholipase family protein [Chitinophagaceae bacterium]